MRQKRGAQQVLQRGHDDVDVEGHTQAQQQARARANDSHHRPLHHKNAHDAGRAGAQGAQYGDVGALVGDRHHQGTDQVERGHRHDEGEDDEHHAFFHLYGGKPAAVLPRPVAHQVATAQCVTEVLRHQTRLVQVAQLQAHAGGAF